MLQTTVDTPEIIYELADLIISKRSKLTLLLDIVKVSKNPLHGAIEKEHTYLAFFKNKDSAYLERVVYVCPRIGFTTTDTSYNGSGGQRHSDFVSILADNDIRPSELEYAKPFPANFDS